MYPCSASRVSVFINEQKIRHAVAGATKTKGMLKGGRGQIGDFERYEIYDWKIRKCNGEEKRTSKPKLSQTLAHTHAHTDPNKEIFLYKSYFWSKIHKEKMKKQS